MPVKWVLQKDEENNIQFARRIQPQLNDFSLVIFTTIEKDIRFFKSYTIRSPKALVVHKLNMFINPHKSFLFNEEMKQRAKDLVKILRYYLFNERKIFLDFVKSFDHLIFPSEQVQAYLIQQGWDKGLPPHSVIDFAVHEQLTSAPSNTDVIHITIPGIISSKSRDYEMVLEAFREIKLSRPVKLNLLGKPKGRYGQKIVAGFRALQQSNLTVQTYDDFIEQLEFDKVLQQSDFLLLPISRFMKVSIFKELNGFTCVSGNINDMMRFGIPALIAGFYPLDKNLKALIRPFNDANELRALVESWVDEEIYLEVRERFELISKTYQISQIAKSVRKSVLDLVIKHSMDNSGFLEN